MIQSGIVTLNEIEIPLNTITSFYVTI